ncbi:MAG: dethiobiotin synthase [Methyloprofundus sp.]|nr:dethiobiotin synthase [Methyloprofundus sp.]
MAQGYFVTGTDTEIGKTWASLALMEYFQQQGKVVVGMKPVAAGCEMLDGQLKNEDALQLQEQSSVDISYDLINPYAFLLPVSPHIAAKKENKKIELIRIKQDYQKLAALADVVVVEGVGGWLVPLNEKEDVSDLAVELNLPIIVVVGMRLGCINQAKLTFGAISRLGLRCEGWIASCVEKNMDELEANIKTLKGSTDMPLLAIFPYEEKRNYKNHKRIQIKPLNP